MKVFLILKVYRKSTDVTKRDRLKSALRLTLETRGLSDTPKTIMEVLKSLRMTKMLQSAPFRHEVAFLTEKIEEQETIR